tara:strand:- start:675 stop:1493 length:819 start_codon:yes stop_codon:yes gene_type:complete
MCKRNPSLEETEIVGKEVYGFLKSEGFDLVWDENPDSFITIRLDKDLQNYKDPFDLILEIHIPDKNDIKEKIRNLDLYTAPNEFNKCLNLAFQFIDGESVWDVLKRNVFDWRDIQRYCIYLENEEDQIDIMPSWDFYGDWLDDYLEIEESQNAQKIPNYDVVNRVIKILYIKDKINESTFKFLILISEIFRSHELLENENEFFNEISTYNSLKNFLSRNLQSIKEDEELWKEISNKLKIGESRKYPTAKEFMDDLNYEIMTSVLSGRFFLKY